MNTHPCTIYFVLVGETTLNEDGYPKATKSALKEAQTMAEFISQEIGNGKVQLVCSSSISAEGTIKEFKDIFGGEISRRSDLAEMKIVDREKAKELFQNFTGLNGLADVYPQDPRFEDGIVEKRSKIKERFMNFFGTVINESLEGDLPDNIIIITHIEVIWWLKGDSVLPLLPGEIVKMVIKPDEKTRTVRIEKIFRGQTKNYFCRTPVDAFMTQIS